MASVARKTYAAPLVDPDDLDRILQYDAAVEDFLKDIPLGKRDQENEAPANIAASRSDDEDKEVQVKRKRRPIPKLDEDRYNVPLLRIERTGSEF